MKKKFRTLTKAQIKELQDLLLTLDAPSLSTIYSYIRGLIQVTQKHEPNKK